ncbi:hypothetical protein ACH4MG_18185 [Streptomyces sp. NPDC017454]|uniref:hypothetical protein n=1 Tax=Streptomyces sp. NPDC017454 TaxID=3364997 RepID=UPI0037BACCEF
MTPWLRTLRATGLVGVLGVGALLSPCGVAVAHGAGPAMSRAATSPSSSAPVPAPVHRVFADPGGFGGRDGRGGHERPRLEDGHDGPGIPDSPDAGPAAPTATKEPGPAGSPPRDSATPSPPSPSASSSSVSSTASASASGAPEADPEPSRAGSRPGEGRQRPGRPEERKPAEGGTEENAGHRTGRDGGEDTLGDPDAAVSSEKAALVPSPSLSRAQPQAAGTHAEDATGPVLRVLPLGSGLVLIGLGLALAFVGLHLRRG